MIVAERKCALCFDDEIGRVPSLLHSEVSDEGEAWLEEFIEDDDGDDLGNDGKEGALKHKTSR